MWKSIEVKESMSSSTEADMADRKGRSVLFKLPRKTSAGRIKTGIHSPGPASAVGVTERQETWQKKTVERTEPSG